jgi:hypothetical protein
MALNTDGFGKGFWVAAGVCAALVVVGLVYQVVSKVT